MTDGHGTSALPETDRQPGPLVVIEANNLVTFPKC